MIVDIHSHILPNIDDGSKSMEMTLEMLRNAEEKGTKEIVATPHYLLDYGEATISEVKSLVDEVNLAAEKEGINIKIYNGQEVYFNENIINNFLEGNIGTINDSRYMLIEFSMHEIDKNVFDVIYELQIRNIVPIIAHPERYKPIREKVTFINDFIEAGFLFQMNAGSIEGKFGESVRKTAKIFLENNIYNFIGSDAHDIDNRTTGLQKAINILNRENKENINEHIFEKSSEDLLKDNVVKFIGKKVKAKKSIFSFLKI
ncbi:CpsB/CapC family capsule biosynthesis tyrosine phosphatase [Clostridium sp.]|uniref:tyrosine-protein phosphatase n=1 Tax=Clostridium sp. TaxID=1506 RepID=UPI0026225AF9|nr:CpsB/CapC family capsule biosynthesis tyrosine phosphatase [Clostridium sp.]